MQTTEKVTTTDAQKPAERDAARDSKILAELIDRHRARIDALCVAQAGLSALLLQIGEATLPFIPSDPENWTALHDAAETQRALAARCRDAALRLEQSADELATMTELGRHLA